MASQASERGPARPPTSSSWPGWGMGRNDFRDSRLGLNILAPCHNCYLSESPPLWASVASSYSKGLAHVPWRVMWEWDLVYIRCLALPKRSCHHPALIPLPFRTPYWTECSACRNAALPLSFLGFVLFHVKVVQSLRAGAASCPALHVPQDQPQLHCGLLNNTQTACSEARLPPAPASLSSLLQSGLQPEKAQDLPHHFLQPPDSWAATEGRRQGAAPDQRCYTGSLPSLLSWIQLTFLQGSLMGTRAGKRDHISPEFIERASSHTSVFPLPQL